MGRKHKKKLEKPKEKREATRPAKTVKGTADTPTFKDDGPDV